MCRASIIIVIWNGEMYLRDCLESVLSQRGPADEIIVVDNASTDGSVRLIQKGFPQVKLIENSRNLGFAGGANVGLRASAGRFLVLLNQDVVMLPGWLDALLEIFDMPGVGIAGCKLLYPDGKIQHAGGIICWPLGLPDHVGYGQPDDGRWDELRDVDYVTGAAWGFRREVMEQIGLLDEGFWPGYYEEVDYCFRARQAGWRVVYNPKSVGIHQEASSLGKGSKIYNEAMERGRLRFVLKHTPLTRLKEEFFPAEEQRLRDLSTDARSILAYAYFATLLSLPQSLEMTEKTSDNFDIVIERFANLHLLALSSLVSERSARMSHPDELHLLPALREFDFPSRVPVIGPVISFVRRLLYSLTAKWGVWAVIQQQNQINRMVEEWLRNQKEWLRNQSEIIIDLDRDLTLLARTVAEIEVRQRYLFRVLQSQSGIESSSKPEE